MFLKFSFKSGWAQNIWGRPKKPPPVNKPKRVPATGHRRQKR